MDCFALVCVSSVLILAAGPPARGQASSLVAPDPDAASPGSVLLGSVSVDPDRSSLSFSGHVNQVSGAVELLVCGPGGKTHESVFVTDVDPMEVQAALLLLGLRQAAAPPCGPDQARPGTLADVWIQWSIQATTSVVRAESTLFHQGENRVLPRSGWVLTGSESIDGVFMACEEEGLIATYCSPWAILNLNHPAARDDALLTAHESGLPPLGTPVRIVIKPRHAEPSPAPGLRGYDAGGEG